MPDLIAYVRSPAFIMMSLALRLGKNGAILAFACLLVAGCIGVSTGDHPSEAGMDEHHDDAAMDHAKDHTEELYELDESLPLPTIVSMEVTKDRKAGYNLHLVTRDFRFAPEHASGENVDGEGHAHIYVDGVKINRLYGDWYHIPSLASGERVIRVLLNTNDHRAYARNGRASMIEQKILVP